MADPKETVPLSFDCILITIEYCLHFGRRASGILIKIIGSLTSLYAGTESAVICGECMSSLPPVQSRVRRLFDLGFGDDVAIFS